MMTRPNPLHALVLFATLAATAMHAQPQASARQQQQAQPLRPPAVPLVTHDPYFSIWSTADRLTHEWPRHWTGANHSLSGLVRVDGRVLRFMGNWRDTDPMEQESLEVTPTRTTYTFRGHGVRLVLSFLSPLLPDDLDVQSRPLTYVTLTASSADGKPHAVQLYFDAAAEIAVNTPNQPVKWDRQDVEGMEVMRVGTVEQPVLAKAGDNIRIDWGHLYVAVPKQEGQQGGGGLRTAIAADAAARGGFAKGGGLPEKDDARTPRPAGQDWPVLAAAWDLGQVAQQPVTRHVMLAYDQIEAIQLMGRNLKPYWRRGGLDAAGLLKVAAKERGDLHKRCDEFDKKILADARAAGGEPYARLVSLAYRQTLAAHGLVADEAGEPLHFSKENFSNGCIGTVDVIYPAAPFFLLLNPQLLKAQLVPVLEYAQSPKWKFPFAPHDLGTYPKANGQVYGGGERDVTNQMPVEESGNMLIMVAALAKIDGNAEFAKQYWPVLTKWAEYLRDKGMDPENQLSTDDFAGHLARNTNLSIKAIVALGGYAQLCEQLGKKDEAAQYRKLAEGMAARWQQMAADGDHYVLAFGSPGTWSQKYNLVWDDLLGLNLFPDEIDAKESAYYMTRMNRFGLPLDNRRGYTKLDWEVWTLLLMPQKEQRQALLAAIDRFVQETPNRVPLCDWYQTADARQSGFQARSVVGGVFILMLEDEKVWKKWTAEALAAASKASSPSPGTPGEGGGEAAGEGEAAVAAAAQQPAQRGQAKWAPKKARLMTRWAKEVSPENALPEYPRPQMVRKDWLNLNGLWEYAVAPKEGSRPQSFAGQILVPFPIESALSGVMQMVKPDQRLWYRRTFAVPKEWGNDKRVLLHFGAVDWDTTVYVNGREVGKHRGGYDPFSFDVTDALKRDAGEQELVVSVWDPTDTGYQPIGKQTLRPRGIWYTPTTGIWQTVWLEPVPRSYVAGLRVVPDLDNGRVRVTVDASGPGGAAKVRVNVQTAAHDLKSVTGKAGEELAIEIPDVRPWTPDDPHLYNLNVTLEDTNDVVSSYFGMRKISLGKDEKGVTRVMLNNKFLFQYGPLDQGFWPDGLYTAPTDEALKFDIEVTKKLGFNMARKHVKVEPARWYYWCDRLGLLVWQDMPSGEKHIGRDDPDIVRSKESAENFEREWKSVMDALRHFPSVVMWVPFNEGWGQYDTARVTKMTKDYDPSRLVNSASGWTDRGTGDVHDVHVYPGPGAPKAEANRAIVLGEFGGLGLPLEGHTWLEKGNWGYRSYTSKESLTEAYVGLLTRLHRLIGEPGLSAAVYTQTTDVEIEVNGLYTYDRQVLKMDEKAIVEAARKLHTPPPQVVTLLPDARTEAATWKYTLQRPAGDEWHKPDFRAEGWQTGPGGFGSPGTPGAVVKTEWRTPEIWVRREFELTQAPTALKNPHLVIHHDEDADVYLNGVPVVRLSGHTQDYTEVPLSKAARAALRPGRNVIAVHVKQTNGGQYIDAGLADVK